MKVSRLTIRTEEPLADAIRLAPSLVGPADGYASFDVKFLGYVDELGRFTMHVTGDAHFSYVFYNGARRGHYKLREEPKTAPAVELGGSLWGLA